MQPQLVDTDLIRTFVAVCDAGSFRAAAERVHRTPSAVSMQMAKLEEQATAALFIKEGRSVRLSPAGEDFLGYARRILSLLEEAQARVARPALGGVVRFGAPDDFELRLMTAALPRFAKLCPDAELEVVIDYSINLLDKVARGELDLAFVDALTLGPKAPRDLVRSEPLVWVGCVGGSAKLRRPLPLAVPSVTCVWRHLALDALERAGVPHRVAFSCEFSQGLMAAVQADLTVAAMPVSYVVPGAERITDVECLPALPMVTVALAVSPEAGDAGRTLANLVCCGGGQASVPFGAGIA